MLSFYNLTDWNISHGTVHCVVCSTRDTKTNFYTYKIHANLQPSQVKQYSFRDFMLATRKVFNQIKVCQSKSLMWYLDIRISDRVRARAHTHSHTNNLLQFQICISLFNASKRLSLLAIELAVETLKRKSLFLFSIKCVHREVCQFTNSIENY